MREGEGEREGGCKLGKEGGVDLGGMDTEWQWSKYAYKILKELKKNEKKILYVKQTSPF